MTTTTERASTTTHRSSENIAELLRRLGDIPAQRVRYFPMPATQADVEAIDAHEDRLFELVDGVLVEKGTGYHESWLAGVILSMLNAWVIPRKLGIVSGEAGMMRLYGAEVRIPDAAFVSWERLGGRMPREAVPHLVPNLVVEVLSAGNTKREMKRKRREYFTAGVRLVWEVDAKARTVGVYVEPEKALLLREGQVLDGGDVLPGFRLPLSELFAEPQK